MSYVPLLPCPGRPILKGRIKRFTSGFLWNRASQEYESLPGFIILGERFSVYQRYRASSSRETWHLVNARRQGLGLGAGEENYFIFTVAISFFKRSECLAVSFLLFLLFLQQTMTTVFSFSCFWCGVALCFLSFCATPPPCRSS